MRDAPGTSTLVDDLEALARFGADGDGVSRFAWTPALMAAYAWTARRMEEAGLETEIDAAGNLIGRWQVGSGRATVVGSHLDTVPCGGRYDGALGVLAGLQAVRLLRERGCTPRRPLWIVAFMDEEGARFSTSMFGSRAFVGDDVSQLGDRTDAEGTTLRQAIAAAGFDLDRAPEARRIEEIGAYLELHIEQGPVLERGRHDVGVVTGIAGQLGLRARYLGAANHAGTTPMTMRRDALAGAARAIVAVRDRAAATDAMMATVGSISARPGGSNVVPGEAEFTLDLRSAQPEVLSELIAWTREELSRIAGEESLELEVTETHRLQALPLPRAVAATLERAAADEGASAILMPSGAGHDAMIVGRHVPAGMLFVPSVGGVSHNPAELTEPRSCELGARVLARALELDIIADPEQVPG